MKTFYIINLLFLLLLYSCNDKSNNKTILTYSKIVSIEKDKLIENNLFDSLISRFVPLETNERCLISHINKIIAYNNLIFVLDEQNKKLFVFNEEGHFLNTIGKIGQGPEELLSMVDFYINEEKEYVGIYDILRSDIIRFRFDGTFIERNKFGAIPQFDKFSCMYNGYLILETENSRDYNYQYVVIKEKDYTLVEECFPYWVQGYKYGLVHNSTMGLTSKGILVSPDLSDTIFLFDGENFMPAFIIQSNLKHATKDVANKWGPYISSGDERKPLMEHGYSIGIDGGIVTTSNVFFTWYWFNGLFNINDFRYIFWNIDDKKGFTPTNSKGYNNAFFMAVPSRSYCRDAFICVIPAYEVLEYPNKVKENRDPKIMELLKNVDYEDNPILVFYYTR